MKKLFLASALALASLASQAETAYVGDWSSTTVSSSYEHVPYDTRYKFGFSQALYTKNDLVDSKLFVDNHDGTGKKAKIQNITFKMYFDSDYGMMFEGSFSADVYIQNISSTYTTFPNPNNPQWFDVEKTYIGHVESEEYDQFMPYDEDELYQEFTITFDENNQFTYDGEGILLTFISSGTLTGMSDYPVYPVVFTVNSLQSASKSAFDYVDNETVALSNTSKELPVLKIDFTYEDVTGLPVRSEISVNDPELKVVEVATTSIQNAGSAQNIEVGWNSEDIGNNEFGEIFPYDLSNYTNGFAQALYTASDLNLPHNSDGTKAEIQSITFKLANEYSCLTGSFESTVYIQNVGDETFPNNIWFEVNTAYVGHVSSEQYNTEDIVGDIELTINFDKPFIYEGESILITFISEGQIVDEYGGTLAPIVFTANGTQSACKSANIDLSNTTGTIENKSNELPALKIKYTPVKVITNRSNDITATFSINDPDETGKYSVYLDNTLIGNFTEDNFTIHYLQLPKPGEPDEINVVVYSLDENGGQLAEGRSTISRAAISELFSEPVVGEAVEGKQAVYGKPFTADPYTTKMTVTAAAQMLVKTPAPVATVSFLNSGATRLTANNEYFADLIPEETYTEEGIVEAFVIDKLNEVDVKYGKPIFTGEVKTVTIKPSVVYPIAKNKKNGNPSLTAGEWVDGTSKNVSIDGVSFSFVLAEDNVPYTRSLPSEMKVGSDNDNFVVYATQGHVIKYAICEYGDEAGELTEGGNEIEVVSLEALKGKRIDYANVNEEGVADKDGHMYFGEDGKEFTDIIKVSVPELSLIRVTDDKTGKSAIDIVAEFTFDDPKGQATHYVFVNNVQLSHSLSNTSTDFAIHFLQYGDEDVHVTIKAAGTSPSMGWATISADAIKALFDVAAPEVKLTATDIHGFYDTVIPDAKTMDVTVAGQYTVTAAVPVVDVVFYDDNAQSFSSKHELGKVFGDLVSDVVVDDTHTVAFAQTFEEAVPVQYGWHITEQADIATSISLTPTLIYPIAVVDNYALSQYENKDWYVAEPVDGATSFELGSVTLDINLADIDNDKYTRVYAPELETRHDSEYFVIYAPEGHTVSYKVTNIEAQEEPEEAPQAVRALKAPAKEEYESTDENIVKLPMSDLKGKMVYYYSVDGEGNTHHDGYQVVEENGDVSGIFSIEADSFNDDVEYYNLQGVRVRGNLAPGFYIRRQGTSTAKVQVR